MENLPSGDIQAKYQKLAAEYSKLRVHVKVLKKGVLDEQAKSNELRELLKDKEKTLRKGELEIDSLTFRNQQLTRRVSVLQDELDALQNKLTKKTKSKTDERKATTSNTPSLDPGLLQEELQKKIIENAQYASQLSDKTFEVSQLQASVEDYQRHICESESKYKCEIAKLKNKNQELHFALEEAQKLGVSKPHASSQAASCNGDFISEAGSLVGSEDALSSVDDLNINEQPSTKVHTLEKENQKLRLEYELLEMENESLKLELRSYLSDSQKKRGETLDSGDFNSFSETSVDAAGRVSGLLGALTPPIGAGEGAGEAAQRERRVRAHYRALLAARAAQRDAATSELRHYVKECEMLQQRFEEMEREKEAYERALQEKHDTISRLEEELQSTCRNYEQQLRALTEHAAALHARPRGK
ncbi:unnamed protein product, partial [Brenthis ino]